MSGPACIVACDAFRLEIERAIEGTPLSGSPLRCFPAACHGNAALPATVFEQARATSATLHVFGGPCTRAIAAAAEAAGVPCAVHAEEQCQYLVASPALVDALQAEGAFVATPGWLARWRHHLADLGLGDDLAGSLFRESVGRLVLLDPGQRPLARGQLETMATAMGVASGVVPVALDHLRRRVQQGVASADRPAPPRPTTAASRAVAEYAMALDLLGDLDELPDRDAVLRRVAEVCGVLLSPRALACWSVEDGAARLVACEPALPGPPPPPLEVAPQGQATATGVVMPLRHLDQLLGLLLLDGVLLPAHLPDYLHVVRFVARLGALAIHNLQHRAPTDDPSGAPLLTMCAYCKDVRQGGHWMRVESYLLRLPLLVSHGICPTCFEHHFGPLEEEPG